MMTHDDNLPHLLATLMDERLSDAESHQLEQRLLDDPAARLAYLDHFVLASYLEMEHRAEDKIARLDPADMPVAGGRSSETSLAADTRRQSLLQWASRHPKGPAIAIAATLLIAALVVMGLVPVKEWVAGGKAKPDDSGPVEKKEFVAKLSNWQDDVWLEGTRPPRREPRLKPGTRLVLASGLIELTYNTGARVVIEGPAEFVVLGSKSGLLQAGRLAARVIDEKANGFVVDSKHVQVEDVGTEFGVTVRQDGRGSVVVFDGKVNLNSVATGETLRTLVADEAVELLDERIATGEFFALAGNYRRANVPLVTLRDTTNALVLDLSAASGTDTQVDGAVVKSWSDAATKFIRSGADARYVADSGEGIPAIDFDRSAPFLGDISSASDSATIGDATIFVWAKFDGYRHGTASSSYYYSIGDAKYYSTDGAGNEHTLGRDGNDGTDYLYHYDGAGETRGPLQRQPAGWNLYIARFYGKSMRGKTSAEVWIDKVGDGAVVKRAADLTNRDGIAYEASASAVRVGAWTNAKSGLDGQIRALRIYNVILPDAQIQAVAKEITGRSLKSSPTKELSETTQTEKEHQD